MRHSRLLSQNLDTQISDGRTFIVPTYPQSPGNPCLALLHPQPPPPPAKGRVGKSEDTVSGKFTPMAFLSQRLPGSLKGEGQSQSHLCSPDLSLHFPPILPVALWVGILIRQSGGFEKTPPPLVKSILPLRFPSEHPSVTWMSHRSRVMPG